MKRNHKISQAHDVDYHIMKAYRTKMSKNVLFSTKLKKNRILLPKAIFEMIE